MILLDFIRSFLGKQAWKEMKDAPGWRPRSWGRRTKSRTPFEGRGKRYGTQHMHVETFNTRDARDERFRELRAAKTPHLNKYSDGRYVWCVVRP